MAKCTYGRWAIINKEGHEFGNLGWFANCDKVDVLAYCKEQDIKIQEGEHIKVVEEKEKFEGHLTPLREVINKELTTESIEGIVDIKHHLQFMRDKNNKDQIDVDEMVLRGLYNFFKLEGYNEIHLSKVIYSETFEHKGIKY